MDRLVGTTVNFLVLDLSPAVQLSRLICDCQTFSILQKCKLCLLHKLQRSDT